MDIAGKKDFNYYTYKIGVYLPEKEWIKPFRSYEAETEKLVWNVFHDNGGGKIEVINVFEYNSSFLTNGLLYAKKNYADNFKAFANHVRQWLMHEFWARCECETIISSWPTTITQEELNKLNHTDPRCRLVVTPEVSYKIDVYTQIMLNWDRFIDYIWQNKKLITKKKLGIE